MLPYSRGLILDNTNNYGIVKTETLIGFGPNRDGYVGRINTSDPLEWIIAHENFAPRSLKVSEDAETSRKYHTTIEVSTAKPKVASSKTSRKGQKHPKKKLKRKPKGVKKCIVKFLNKDGSDLYDEVGGGKKHGTKFHKKLRKRIMMPLILGLLAAKSLLIPIALKALALLSAKGLMMGLFSTVLASVLSLKSMFAHSYGYQNRKDDTKTQVEIIQVPSKNDEVYFDEHYKRRNDYDIIHGVNPGEFYRIDSNKIVSNI